jgi:RNA polymerase sigma-70 factor (ECF subfamily)
MNDQHNPSPDELLTHAVWVRRLSRKLVIDPSLSDDVEQQTWLRALQAQRDGQLGNVRRPRAWLSGIARNVRKEMVRGDIRRETREAAAARPEALPAAEELVERAELQTRVARAVLELDEPYRSTLLLRYFEELAPEEIALRLGVPGSTVRNRLSRGLARLRERFDREDGDRRTWVLSLLPLALGVRSADLTPLLASFSASPVLLGGTFMLVIKGIGVAALLLAVGVGTKLSLERPGGPPLLDIAKTFHPEHFAQPGQGDSVQTPHATQSGAQKRTDATKTDAQKKDTPTSGELPRPTISGRVVDRNGDPVAGALIFIGGNPSPFENPSSLIATGEDHILTYEADKLEHAERFLAEKGALAAGRIYGSMPDGRYWDALPEGSKVYVAAVAGPGIRTTGSGAWHELPAKNVDFTVDVVPTGTLRISVRNKETGEQLPRFVAEVGRDGEQAVRLQTQEPVVSLPVEIPPDELHRFTVRVLEPLWAKTTVKVDARIDQTVDVELEVDPGLGLRGLVVDASGTPLENAFVYWGDVEEMRPDPMSGFDPTHVLGGVRSDASGWFQLPGESSPERTGVTVWHEQHSSVTVAAAEATFVQLPPRGSIRGRLLDDEGRPLAGRTLHLDRRREVESDANGEFVIDNVAAGLHGLFTRLEDKTWYVGVQVTAGEQIAFERKPGIETTIELRSGGEPFGEKVGGVLIGLTNPFRVAEWGSRGEPMKRDDLPRGRHLLLSMTGLICEFDVESPRSSAELGDSDLTVAAEPGTRLFLVPEAYAANKAVGFMADHTARRVPASGELVFAPMNDGRYELHVTGKPNTHPETIKVTIDGPGSRFVLPQ